MILIKNLSLQFGSQVIFDNISFTLQPEDKIGLVGRNGTGKSTMLKIIAGQTDYDKGDVEIPKGFRVAYMPQEVVITSEKNVVDETMSCFDYLDKLAAEKEQLEAIILDDPTAEDMMRYADIEHELLEHNFDKKRAQAQEILTGLGFDKEKQEQQVNQLSVGWRMRIVLAKLLLQDADFYLFDEPTNHLDITAKNWFLEFLKQGSFGYMLVCHDRYFLDKACNKTYELSMGKLTIYHGNYSFFLEQREIRSQYLQQAYEQQQREIKQREKTIERFRASATKSAMAQSMIKQLDKVERIEIDRRQKVMNLKIHTPQRSGEYVATIKNVSFGFKEKLFENVSFEIARGDKVALIAPNGTGKTTLFNLIAKKLELQHGSIALGHNVSVALFDQDQERILDPKKSIVEEVTASCPRAPESQIRSTLGALLFSGDDVYKLTKVLSGGERNRVAMAKVILSNANFFLLDEPTNHLDIESKEVILKALQNYEGTILFVSHDQDFVNKLATKIIELTPKGVNVYAGNYDQYLASKAATQHATTAQNKVAEKITPVKAKSTDKELYELQKKAKNAQNKIKRLEEQLTTAHSKLSNHDYGTPEYDMIQKEIEQTQSQLKSTSQEWENMQRTLESKQ